LPYPYWYWVTATSDTAVMLPLATLLAAYFAADSRALARKWLLSFVPMLLLVLGSKLAYLKWHLGVAAWDFRGASGHMFYASAVFPTLLYALLGHTALRHPARHCWIAGMLLAALVGVSRVVLGYHFVSEVIVGAMLGGASSALFLATAPPYVHQTARKRWFVAAAIVIVLVQYGKRAPTDAMLAKFADARIERSPVGR